MRNDDYDFKKYGELANFGNKLYNRKLSLKKSENKQNELLNLIYELEESITKHRICRPPSDDNEKDKKRSG